MSARFAAAAGLARAAAASGAAIAALHDLALDDVPAIRMFAHVGPRAPRRR